MLLNIFSAKRIGPVKPSAGLVLKNRSNNMILQSHLRNKMHAAQRRMSEIERNGHVPSAFRYKYQELIRKAKKCREQLLMLEDV